MSISLPRFDLAQIFCDIDDFDAASEVVGQQLLQLPDDGEAQPYRSRLSVKSGHDDCDRLSRPWLADLKALPLADFLASNSR